MTSDNRGYYQILGVANDASFEEIRAAFRERARENHPDRNPSPDATERMQEINEAWEVLRDEEQKASYDRARRHFAATDGRLQQARAAAILIVGELAFHLGWDIGARTGNEWARASIGGENTPGALWAAVLEAVLESALAAGDDISSMQRAAREAAWTGAHNETARQARRHALYESADSVTEAISIDIAITAVGVLASTMGKQLGETSTRIKPRSKAWEDVFEAAQAASLEGLSRYGDILAKGGRLRDSTFATIADYAATAGRTALQTYVNRIEAEKRKRQGSQDKDPRYAPGSELWDNDLWDNAAKDAARRGRIRRKLIRPLRKATRRLTLIIGVVVASAALLLVVSALTSDRAALEPFTTLAAAATDDGDKSDALSSWGRGEYEGVRNMFNSAYGGLTSWEQHADGQTPELLTVEDEHLPEGSQSIVELNDPTFTPVPIRNRETTAAAAALAEQPRNYIDWTIRPEVKGGILEFAGSIQERRRQDWTLCDSGDWGKFAIYQWPPPLPSYVQRTELVLGSILEPLSSGQYYLDLAADEVVADLWDVDCSSFYIRAKVSSVWPSSFRVGIWAEHQRNPAEWGLMDDEKASVS